MNLIEHQLIKQYIEQNSFGRLLKMEFSILSPGIVSYKISVGVDHLATPHAAHGGLISSLMDAVVGVGALSAVCEEGKVVSTVEMNITFFQPALLDDQLTATSTLLKKGNRLIFMEGKIENQRNELMAKASATMNAYPKEKAGY